MFARNCILRRIAKLRFFLVFIYTCIYILGGNHKSMLNVELWNKITRNPILQMERPSQNIVGDKKIFSWWISHWLFHFNCSKAVTRYVLFWQIWDIIADSFQTFHFLGQIYPIFTLYNQDDDEQLSVTIGGDVSIYYEDTDELPLDENYISFGLSLDDGE